MALGVLQAAQLIPGIALAKRVQRHQRARRALLQQAIEAGERERARLARVLHDDIIQDLAGLAYALDALPSADGSVAPSEILQGSIRKVARGHTGAVFDSGGRIGFACRAGGAGGTRPKQRNQDAGRNCRAGCLGRRAGGNAL